MTNLPSTDFGHTPKISDFPPQAEEEGLGWKPWLLITSCMHSTSS